MPLVGVICRPVESPLYPPEHKFAATSLYNIKMISIKLAWCMTVPINHAIYDD